MSRRTASLFSLTLLTLIVAYSQSGWADAERGKAFYQLCASCHGSQGEGRIDREAPAIAGLPEWYVLAQLKKFRDGARGRHPRDIAGMRMRPMARSIPTDEDVKAVAQYVTGLPSQVPPSTVPGDPANGAAQYVVCMACHGPDGRGNPQIGAPPLVTANDWYLLAQLEKFKRGVRGTNPEQDMTGAMMIPMASALDEQAMKDVIAYIQTLR
jgi:cytochrome c553